MSCPKLVKPTSIGSLPRNHQWRQQRLSPAPCRSLLRVLRANGYLNPSRSSQSKISPRELSMDHLGPELLLPPRPALLAPEPHPIRNLERETRSLVERNKQVIRDTHLRPRQPPRCLNHRPSPLYGPVLQTGSRMSLNHPSRTFLNGVRLTSLIRNKW